MARIITKFIFLLFVLVNFQIIFYLDYFLQSPPEKTKAAIITAIKAGYRYIDCANDYANEHVIGEALKELFNKGAVKRSDLFIQAKLWNTNHRPEHVEIDLDASLKDLQLDYVDSYIIHWPTACPSTGKNATVRTNGSYLANHKESKFYIKQFFIQVQFMPAEDMVFL